MQLQSIDESKIFEMYRSKTPRSLDLFSQAEKVSPGGVMAGIKFFPPYPIFMNRAKGSRLWDVDGNEYVDYLLSYGALMLGHGDPKVKRAVELAFSGFGTTVTGTPTELETEYGKALRDIYNKSGLLRFTNSGLEATILAIRLAKAFTGKRRIAKFEGHYHGANDRLLVSYAPRKGEGGESTSPEPASDSLDVDEETLRKTVVLPFNDWESTEKSIISNADTLSCVILEPFEDGVIAGEKEFMINLRKLTADLGIVLIYDEVKTGFRVRPGGASEYYSITPDVTCLGKVIGGGLPAGAVVGNEEIMRLLDPRSGSAPERVFHSGTFNGNPAALSAGKATVEALLEHGSFEMVVRTTSALKRSVARLLAEHQIPAEVTGEGTMFGYYITKGRVKNYRDVLDSDLRLKRYLDLMMICKGTYLKPAGRYSLSMAHSEGDVSLTAERFEEVLGEVASSIPR